MLPHPIRTLFILILLTPTFSAAQKHHAAPDKFNEATIAQLQADMASGKVTSLELTQFYITRILLLDQKGPGVNSVIQLNPDVLAQARDADAMMEKSSNNWHRASRNSGSKPPEGLPGRPDSTRE